MELRAGSTPKGPTLRCVHTSAESLQDGKGGEPGSLPTPSQAGSLMLLHWGGVSQLSPTGIKFPGDSAIERGTGSYAIRVDCPVPNSVLPPEKPCLPCLELPARSLLTQRLCHPLPGAPGDLGTSL